MTRKYRAISHSITQYHEVSRSAGSESWLLEIDEAGNHVYWPARNVSIDLDVIRYKVDEEFRKAKNMDALSDYQEVLGKAVKLVMDKHKLSKAGIEKKWRILPAYLDYGEYLKPMFQLYSWAQRDDLATVLERPIRSGEATSETGDEAEIKARARERYPKVKVLTVQT